MQEDARPRLMGYTANITSRAPDGVAVRQHVAMPKSIIVGKAYKETVTRIKPYGLFVEVK